jgi:hypothetical protein
MIPSPDTWYYMKNGIEVGPVETAELRRLVERGVLSVDALAWQEGSVGWAPIHSWARLSQPRPASGSGR